MEIDKKHVQTLAELIVSGFYDPAHAYASQEVKDVYPTVDIEDEANENHPASIMYYELVGNWQKKLVSEAIKLL